MKPKAHDEAQELSDQELEAVSGGLLPACDGSSKEPAYTQTTGGETAKLPGIHKVSDVTLKRG